MEHLLVASEKFEDLIIVGISVQPSYDTVERLKSYRENHGIVWAIVRDVDSSVSDKYGISVVPTLVFVDKEGVIRDKHQGVFREPRLSERIDEIPILPPPTSTAFPTTNVILVIVAIAVIALVVYWFRIK